MIPNLVVFKFDGKMYDIPITQEGIMIGDPVEFSSDYDFPDDRVLFMTSDSNCSVVSEVFRIVITEENIDRTAEYLIERDVANFKLCIKTIYLDYVKGYRGE